MAEIPASHRDLLAGDVLTLATISADGHPQLSEVWFLAHGDTVQISLHTSRQKTKNLQRNPACTAFLLDTANPYRYLEIRGDAELVPDNDYAFADKVGAKYKADLRTMDGGEQSRMIVTVHPTRVNAVDMSA